MDSNATLAPRGCPAKAPGLSCGLQALSAIAQTAANNKYGRDRRHGVPRMARPPELHNIDTPVGGLVFLSLGQGETYLLGYPQV
jgi:hypothetical protein